MTSIQEAPIIHGAISVSAFTVSTVQMNDAAVASDPVRTFRRLKTTADQILSNDTVSQSLPDPNENAPVSCQAILNAGTQAAISSDNANGYHQLPPSGATIASHLSTYKPTMNLQDLANVSFPSPPSGDRVLVWEASSSHWEPRTNAPQAEDALKLGGLSATEYPTVSYINSLMSGTVQVNGTPVSGDILVYTNNNWQPTASGSTASGSTLTYQLSQSSDWQTTGSVLATVDGSNDTYAASSLNVYQNAATQLTSSSIKRYSGNDVTVANGTNYIGPWMQYKFPIAFQCDQIKIYHNGQHEWFHAPAAGYIFGSTDGSSWTYLTEFKANTTDPYYDAYSATATYEYDTVFPNERGTRSTLYSSNGSNEAKVLTINSGSTSVFQYYRVAYSEVGIFIPGESQRGNPIVAEHNQDRAYNPFMSADGNTIVIGAGYNDGGGNDSGHARVFEWNSSSSTWDQKGSDIDGDAGSLLGGGQTAISANGSTIAVGGISGDLNGTDSGTVKVFSYNTSTGSWQQLGSTIVGTAQNEQFGKHVSLSNDGTILAVSSAFSLVRIYEYSNNTWNQRGADIQGGSGEWFGGGLSLSGDGNRVAIGAWGYDNYKGKVQVYYFNGSNYVLDANFATYPNLVVGTLNNDFLGYNNVSLSDDGNVFAVGSYTSSYAQVWKKDASSGNWSQYGGTLTGAANSWFGWHVALNANGNLLAVGAPKVVDPNDSNITSVGMAQIYEATTNAQGNIAWVQRGITRNGAFQDQQFGWRVALSDDGLVLAVASNDYPQGQVAVYDVGTELTGDTSIKQVQVRFVQNNGEYWPRKKDVLAHDTYSF